jgi:hypothetical protein
MTARAWELSLPPQLLQRGFLVYAWKIVGRRDEQLCFVGMTGDVSSPNCGSLFAPLRAIGIMAGG